MTLHSSYHSIRAQVVNLMSLYGEALQERREVAGYAKQGEAAAASAKLAAEYPTHFQAFSQQWLSRLEADTTGELIRKAQPLRLASLAYLLKLDSTSFFERVGVPVAPIPLLDHSLQSEGTDTPPSARSLLAGARGWKVPKPEPKPLPDSLLEAAELYGSLKGFEGLSQYRWQRWLANLDHKRAPTTPEEWRDLYLDFEKVVDPPEPKE